ncbi:MAG: carboxypeptidase regulatory-like domain-containing protein [Candidatus Sumerlaeia bacterium]|nr:carboxypeptidase regulatory-like domain-containing protein [Candidatus Sumerlaeia bacterium]
MKTPTSQQTLLLSLLLGGVLVVVFLLVLPRDRTPTQSGGSVVSDVASEGARPANVAFESWETERAGAEAFLIQPDDSTATALPDTLDDKLDPEGEPANGVDGEAPTTVEPGDGDTTPTLTDGSTRTNGEGERATEGDDQTASADGTDDPQNGEGELASGEDGRYHSDGRSRDPREGTATIAGRVLRGDEPIDNAFLRLVREGDTSMNLHTGTDPEGVFIFPDLESGVWVLTLVDPPAPSNFRRLDLEPGEQRLEEDFLVPNYPRVQGEVLDRESGAMIGGAHVDVYRGANLLGSVTSGSDGAFELPPLEPETYKLEGNATGYLKGEQTFTIPPGGEPPHVFLRLDSAPNIEVLVLGDGGPLSGAQGALFGSAVFGDGYAAQGSRSTGGNGRFTIALPTSPGLGSYRVGAWREGYVPGYSASMAPYTVPENGPLTIQLNRGGSISGLVVDEEDETPLPGVEVAVTAGFSQSAGILQRLSIPYPSTTTDAEGRYELGGIEPGPATVTFSLQGYHAATRSYTVTTGMVNGGTVELEPSDKETEGRVAGILVDEMGRGIPGHGVHIRHVGSGRMWESSTSSLGNFSFENVEEGNYILFTNGSMLRGDDFMTMDQTYPFLSSGGGTTTLIYDLTQSIRLRVVDSAGQPVRRYTVGLILREEGNLGHGGRRESFGMATQRQVQSSDGRGFIQHLLSGRVEALTIQANGATKTLSGMRTPVGRTLDLGDVVLETGGTVVGLVVDGETGNTLPGVSVRAEAPFGAPLSHPLASLPLTTVTSGGGIFELRGVPAGEFDLRLSKGGHVDILEPLVMETGEILDAGTFVMEGGGSFSVLVLDGNGNPLGGARVIVAGISLYTDSEGRSHSDSIPPGLHTVAVSHPFWSSQSRSVEILPQQESFTEFQLLD